MEMSPAQQIKEKFVELLRTTIPASCNVAEGAIRCVLDVSGDPRGNAGIYVQCTDDGSHNGSIHRALVDLTLSATAYTHLEEDADSNQLEGICSEVETAFYNFHPALNGWNVVAVFSPTLGEVSMLANSHRSMSFTCKIFIEKALQDTTNLTTTSTTEN